ncbi:molybdopterin-dependent oxidoreductase [Peribacillus frigoritolerans]|nr:molybdopterin-dependent oxidoreductase [Peribacillus frigoritolerans]
MKPPSKNDGKVTGLRMKLMDNVGAYIRAPEPACLYRNHANSTGAYDIPNLNIEAFAVMTNKSPTGLIRGYGGTGALLCPRKNYAAYCKRTFFGPL